MRVTASLTGYATKSVTSAATGTILRLFTSAPAPRIVGTTRVRYTLTASLGTWSPTPSTTTYRWYRNGVAIAGATARSYRLTSADRGKRIKVVVKRGRTGYVTTTRTSASTRAISRATAHVREHGAAEPPQYLQDAHYPGAAKLGRGEGYVYPHDEPEGVADQPLAPESVRRERFYEPTGRGFEAELRARLARVRERFSRPKK